MGRTATATFFFASGRRGRRRLAHSMADLRPWSPLSEVVRLLQSGRMIEGRVWPTRVDFSRAKATQSMLAMRKYRSFADSFSIERYRSAMHGRAATRLAESPALPRATAAAFRFDRTIQLPQEQADRSPLLSQEIDNHRCRSRRVFLHDPVA